MQKIHLFPIRNLLLVVSFAVPCEIAEEPVLHNGNEISYILKLLLFVVSFAVPCEIAEEPVLHNGNEISYILKLLLFVVTSQLHIEILKTNAIAVEEV